MTSKYKFNNHLTCKLPNHNFCMSSTTAFLCQKGGQDRKIRHIPAKHRHATSHHMVLCSFQHLSCFWPKILIPCSFIDFGLLDSVPKNACTAGWDGEIWVNSRDLATLQVTCWLPGIAAPKLDPNSLSEPIMGRGGPGKSVGLEVCQILKKAPKIHENIICLNDFNPLNLKTCVSHST